MLHHYHNINLVEIKQKKKRKETMNSLYLTIILSLFCMISESRRNTDICSNFKVKLMRYCMAFCNDVGCEEHNLNTKSKHRDSLLSEIEPLLMAHNILHKNKYIIEYGFCGEPFDKTKCVEDDCFDGCAVWNGTLHTCYHPNRTCIDTEINCRPLQ